jgi:hypothetical protein
LSLFGIPLLSQRQRLIGILFQLSLQPIQLLAPLRFEGLQSLASTHSLRRFAFTFYPSATRALEKLPGVDEWAAFGGGAVDRRR